MSGAVRIARLDPSAADLRGLSKKQKNPLVVRRMLAVALVLEGSDRQAAARACGMDRQTLRDWVHHYSAESVAGLHERRTSGHKSPLGAAQRQALAALVGAGPDPQAHKVVRWRRADLQKELKERFAITVHERTVGKYLASLGDRRLSVRAQHPDADPEAQEAFKKTSPRPSPRRSLRTPAASPSKSGSRSEADKRMIQ